MRDVEDALRAGLVVVIPTDTVYGLAVDPSRSGAIERLFAVKERPREVAIPVLAADEAQAFSLCEDVPAPARALAARFWPGPLTLVLRRQRALDIDLGGPGDATIGVRVPRHPVPLALASALGPLAVTSANRHGEATPTELATVRSQLESSGVAAFIDGGRCEGRSSTVVRCLGDELEILRDGPISAGALRACIG